MCGTTFGLVGRKRTLRSRARGAATPVLAIIAVALLVGFAGCDLVAGALGLRELSENITVDRRLRRGTYTVTVQNFTVSANLEIDPGTTIRFESGTGMRVSEFGSITAVGTERRPIYFTSASGNAEDWQGVGIRTNESSINTLEHVVIENAGEYHMYTGDGHRANLFVDENARVSITDSEFRRARIGVWFHGGATIDAFTRNTFDGNTEGAARFVSRRLGSIGADNTFGTNAPQAGRFVRVDAGSDQITTSQTWRKLDVPYRFFDSASDFRYVGIEDSTATVTIAPGARLEFRGSRIGFVVNFGSLVAEGTEDDPITFTTHPGRSVGDWLGITVNQQAEATLRHVIVERAGAYNTRNDFARSNLRVGPEATATVGNSVFRDSSHYGIRVASGGTFNDEGGNSTDNPEGNTGVELLP